MKAAEFFTDAKDTKITGGSIINNETETTTNWGGGGIYINNNGTLMIPSALITNNSAAGLGGGVAGCPHAKIIIGEKETTSAGQAGKQRRSVQEHCFGNELSFEYGAAVQCSCVCCFFW